ncbi:MAG: Holliday junction branch migration protein RuvA [Candidatus Falkowbacteria bacterium]
MIAYLKGTVVAKTNNYIILETGGVGYQVFAGENFLAELKSGDVKELYLHHRVREEASDLYGFSNLEDLNLFELLLSVSGVGPKSALAVLSLASSDDIKEAIIRGDASLLTKVSGIGKKTAERLVLELKTKITRVSSGTSLVGGGLSGAGDELDALMSLGYGLSEAREALNQVEPAITSAGGRVKAALKYLAR